MSETSICSRMAAAVDHSPFVWTGSADQEYVRGEWAKFWRLSPDERSRYMVRRYSACGMIIPVLRDDAR